MKLKNTIIVKEICSGTFTNADGLALYCAVSNILTSDNNVLLSFNGIDSLSSSFLNSSIGNIVDEYGIDILKEKIKITNYTPSLASVIRNYITRFKQQMVS